MAEITLSDYIAICETKARYCRTLGSKDWEGYADVFTEDSLLDTGPAGGYKIQGRDAALRRAEKMGNLGHTGYGQYHEHYVRCPDGRWRIQRQKLTRFHVDTHSGPV